MDGKRRFWAVIAIVSPIFGMLVVRLSLLQPSPPLFFVLGILATLTVVGAILAVRSSRRLAKTQKPIGR